MSKLLLFFGNRRATDWYGIAEIALILTLTATAAVLIR